MDGKIEIVGERNCAWCELPWGSLVYGKNTEEISATLDVMSGYARCHGGMSETVCEDDACETA